MTMIDTMIDTDAGVGASPRRYLMPYPDRVSRVHGVHGVHAPLAGDAAWGSGWDGRVDTLPLLRTTDIRSMERLRTIHAYARQGITEIDAALRELDQLSTSPQSVSSAAGPAQPGRRGESTAR